MSPMKQLSLFPTYDSLEAVMAEAKAQLPITTENEIEQILRIHQNTMLEILKKQQK